MLRRLQADALRADIAAVEGLLAGREEHEDPIGVYQYRRRRENLRRELEQLGATPSTTAAVGLFFGGRPVVGSFGIKSSFGARAVETFQNLVSNQLASHEGPVGARGPARQSDRSQLLVTDVARGSFGFVLEEAGGSFFDSPAKTAVDEVLDLVFRSGSPDEEEFELLTEAIDNRVLGSLASFFQTLDEAGATIRLVEDKREFELDRADVERARERIQDIRIADVEEEMTGRVYVLPDSLRFDLHSEEAGTVRGNVTLECVREITRGTGEIPGEFFAERHDVRLRHRVVTARNRADKHSYTLLGVLRSD